MCINKTCFFICFEFIDRSDIYVFFGKCHYHKSNKKINLGQMNAFRKYKIPQIGKIFHKTIFSNLCIKNFLNSHKNMP